MHSAAVGDVVTLKVSHDLTAATPMENPCCSCRLTRGAPPKASSGHTYVVGNCSTTTTEALTIYAASWMAIYEVTESAPFPLAHLKHFQSTFSLALPLPLPFFGLAAAFP